MTTRPPQVLRGRWWLTPLHYRLRPIRRVGRLGYDPLDADKIERRVALLQRGLSHMTSSDRGIEIALRVAMEQDLGLEPGNIGG